MYPRRCRTRSTSKEGGRQTVVRSSAGKDSRADVSHLCGNLEWVGKKSVSTSRSKHEGSAANERPHHLARCRPSHCAHAEYMVRHPCRTACDCRHDAHGSMGQASPTMAGTWLRYALCTLAPAGIRHIHRTAVVFSHATRRRIRNRMERSSMQGTNLRRI